MHHFLAGSPFLFTYLQDRRALARIDWASVHDDLTDAGTPLNYWRWCDLDALTHVVLASDRETGRHVGVLGLTRRAIASAPWLLIETALVRPQDQNGPLPRAMLAHILARIVCLDGKPVALAAPRGVTALPDLSLAIRSAALHPPVEGNVIAFQAAQLAHGIGGGRIVLDLRAVPEASLLRDLRRLHGVRGEPPRAVAGLTEAPARSGGATRRPRKATRTGRIG